MGVTSAKKLAFQLAFQHNVEKKAMYPHYFPRDVENDVKREFYNLYIVGNSLLN